MEDCSRIIAQYLFKKGYLEVNKIEKIRFSLELVFSQIITFSSLLLIGIMISNIFETIQYLLVFIIVKHFTGGFHANTYKGCFSLTLVNFVIVIYASRNTFEIYILPLLFLIILIYIIKVKTMVKVESKILYDRYFLKSIISIMFFILLALVQVVMKNEKYAVLICNTLLSIIIFMEVERRIEKKL